MPEPQKQNISQLGPIRSDQLFNRLNVLHFQNSPLRVCLKHREHGHTVILKAAPEPVIDQHAVARWIKDEAFPEVLGAFDLVNIILVGSRRTFQFKPERYWIDQEMISFVIPLAASEADDRRYSRFDCRSRGVEATLTQNTLVFSGRLLDYSVAGLLFEAAGAEHQNLSWVNTEAPAMLTVRVKGEVVYTGQVSLREREAGLYILTPAHKPAPRFRSKKNRSRRMKFVPSPDLIIRHPVTGRHHTLKMHDLGSLGFSVEEEATNAVLMPGLLLSRAEISFANSLCVSCKAQVVYSQPVEGEENLIRSGIAILDIELSDHLKLISLVQQAQDPRAYISNHVDAEELFEFFFETGFLYPYKYAEIAGSRDEFRKAYAKLYEQGSDIGRHFVYQKSGQILGHLAMLRVYRNTWMSHHHAAVNSQGAGLRVLRAISEYINDSHLLNPANIKYIIGYFQSEKRFPRRYFGSYVQSVGDLSKTSLDKLAYMNSASRFGYDPGTLAGDWILERATTGDIVEFNGFYDKVSGGLLPRVLDLTPQAFNDPTVAEKYQSNSLSRERKIYALRYQRILKALIDVQESDLGLNLSEIINAMTIYVLDTEACHRDVLRYLICSLAIRYNKMKHPVMFFPHTHLEHYNIEKDKEYTMWALDIKADRDAHSYMEWMNRYCR